MVTVANGFDLPGSLKALAAVEADLNRLASALTEAQFQAPPRTGGWSVSYCIEHVVLTGQAFLPKWDIALKQASSKQRNDDPSFRYRWWQRRLLSYTEPPYTLKSKTTQPFLPCCRRPMKETLNRFFSMHQDFARAVASSRGLDVMRTKVQSPFVSWIWYPLGFSFDLAVAHERRHLWQAWQVRQQIINER